MGYSIRQYVELFHLLFLRQLASGEDRSLIALKGGATSASSLEAFVIPKTWAWTIGRWLEKH